jgi:stage II sporulation protein GA (sporulation sigma-E factor processing peptidase)
METVYADSLIVLNAAVDYLVLLAAGKLCALPLRRGRMALAAAWGGAYALLTVLWPGLFALPTAKLAAGAAMALLAFGVRRRPLRAVVAVYAVGAAFAGAVYAVSRAAGQPAGDGRMLAVSPRVLLLSFALCYAAAALVFRGLGRRPERRRCLVELRLGGAAVSLPALVDNGNELTDPISGDEVLIAEAAALAPLFPDPAPLTAPDVSAALPRLAQGGVRARLVPCACVAAERALLLCFRPDSVRVDGREFPLLVAVSPGRLAPDGDYQAIVPCGAAP